MCLAVPGRVIEVRESDGTRMADLDFGGVVKEVCLEYLPDLQVGDYAIVHVGFALQRLDEESALRTLKLFEELGLLQEEFGDPWEAAAAQERITAEPTVPEPSMPEPTVPEPTASELAAPRVGAQGGAQ
jgi:hydrogenase expression/formation protein HypC